MVILPRPRAAWLIRLMLIVAVARACACGRPAPAPTPIRLVEVRWQARGGIAREGGGARVRPTEWRFDGPAAGPPPPLPPEPARGEPIRGDARLGSGPGCSGLAVRDGLLVGRVHHGFTRSSTWSGPPGSTTWTSCTPWRSACASRRGPTSIVTRPAPDRGPHQAAGAARVAALDDQDARPGRATRCRPTRSRRRRRCRARASATSSSAPPTPPGAEFAIESVRLVFRREHLAGVPSGVSWQGLRDVFRETLVTRSPETVRFDLRLPSRPVLDLALGTPGGRAGDVPGRGRRGGEETPVLTQHRDHCLIAGSAGSVDLAAFAGQAVVALPLGDSRPSRARSPSGARRPSGSARPPRADRGPAAAVILIQGDTLRKDHLDALRLRAADGADPAPAGRGGRRSSTTPSPRRAGPRRRRRRS